ncbi:MAG: transporter substrate-binding domain-containing protein, partial [Sulfurimonas sp.]|nr:transporter substrate-binding domain-containing protein [Sulfurimonas sp.]
KTALFTAMLNTNNIVADDLIKIEHTFNIEDLISGKTDLISCFMGNEPFALDKKGIAYDIWNPKDYGFDFYDVILFTSGSELKNNPERVEAFRVASLKGWEYAFSHIEETADLILKKYNTQNKTKEALIYEAKVLKELAYKNSDKLGVINKSKIKNIFGVYNLMGLTKNSIDLSSFIYKKPISKYIFTDEERLYLKNNPIIKVHNELDSKPYNFKENGEAKGYSIDYIKLLSSKVNLDIEFVSGYNWSEFIELLKKEKIDLILNIVKNRQHQEYFSFTTSYLKIVNSMFTQKDNNYKNLNDFRGKTLAVVKGFYEVDILKQFYPSINLIEVKTDIEAFKMLSFGKVDGTINNIAVGHNLISKYSLTNVVVKFEVEDKRFQTFLHLATNKKNTVLHSILEKAKSMITEDEMYALDDKWLVENKIYETNKLNYKIVKYVLIGIVIVLFLIIYKHFILRKVNKGLKFRIEKEVNENRLKDSMLYQQKKMADMGEMIANIAHQWKQPLATINVTNAIIKEKNDLGILDKKELNEHISDMKTNILHMSQTVEDFLSYFSPNKDKETFVLLDVVKKAIFIINQTIYKAEVDVFIDIDKHLTIYGYKEEYMQVIISIIINAIQALEEKDVKEIYFHAFKQNEKTVLEISDTGGGIPKDLIDRVFEPYFTTKHQLQGTGLGLYIAKMIIESSMKGSIKVTNTASGAKFIISNQAS